MMLSVASPGSNSEGHHDLDLERIVAVSRPGRHQELTFSLVDHDGQACSSGLPSGPTPCGTVPVSRQSSPKYCPVMVTPDPLGDPESA